MKIDIKSLVYDYIDEIVPKELTLCSIIVDGEFLVKIETPFYKLAFTVNDIETAEIRRRVITSAPKTPPILGLCTLVGDTPDEYLLKELHAYDNYVGWLPVFQNFELANSLNLGDSYEVKVTMSYDFREREGFDIFSF